MHALVLRQVGAARGRDVRPRNAPHSTRIQELAEAAADEAKREEARFRMRVKDVVLSRPASERGLFALLFVDPLVLVGVKVVELARPQKPEGSPHWTLMHNPSSI